MRLSAVPRPAQLPVEKDVTLCALRQVQQLPIWQGVQVCPRIKGSGRDAEVGDV